MTDNQKRCNRFNCYIISLKYSPGLWKEFTVIGEHIRKYNYPVRYLIADQYINLGQQPEGTFFLSSSDSVRAMAKDISRFNQLKGNLVSIFSKEPPKFVCFYNPHPLNPFVCRIVKKRFPDAIISLYLHDPFKPDKRDYGIVKSFYISVVDFIQSFTVGFCDYIISPSDYSAKLFRLRYPSFKGKNVVAPLLVPDDYFHLKDQREYFSIIGTAHTATGHDTFAALVNYVAEKHMPYRFAMVSSSNLKPFLNLISEEGKRILTVINRSVLTDREINTIIRKSIAVFRLDKEVTQSGVVPVSYMNQTPIIARNIPGLKQHIDHDKNGYVVPFDCSPVALVEAMNHVKENFLALSLNARSSYDSVWSEAHFDEYYQWLIHIMDGKR